VPPPPQGIGCPLPAIQLPAAAGLCRLLLRAGGACERHGLARPGVRLLAEHLLRLEGENEE
jgi:hypothetical protein